jgi:hypothetical protein
MNRDSIRELSCIICNKKDLPIGLVVFTRGEYKVYCLNCIKKLLNKKVLRYART